MSSIEGLNSTSMSFARINNGLTNNSDYAALASSLGVSSDIIKNLSKSEGGKALILIQEDGD